MDVRKGLKYAGFAAGVSLSGWVGYECGNGMPDFVARMKDPVASELAETPEENETLGQIGAAVFALALPGAVMGIRRFAHDVASDYEMFDQTASSIEAHSQIR